ncbi:MAG: HlyD family secretion protein [Pseudomonadota bacterium]|nr:HlyD family secretion protein [Pseudomonadota bacterium]
MALPGSRLRLVLLFLVPALLVVGSVGYWLAGARYVSTENAYVKADIARVAAEISGRVVEVHVQDHARVARDDVLVTIDRQPFELALAEAQGSLDAARRQVETEKAAWAEAKSELDEAESRADYYQKRAQRQRELSRRGIVSESHLDEMENDLRAARDRIAVVQQKLERALAALGGDPDKPVDEQPAVRARMAARDRARLDLDRTNLRAPLSGTAVKVTLQPGDHVTIGVPVFAIVADTAPWVEANFKETELTHVRVGQRALVELDIYPGVSWQAIVESISPATGAEFAVLPPQNASGNWVKVVQRLPVRLRLELRPDAPPLRAGMTAAVTVDTGRERKFSDIFGVRARALP